MYPYGVGFAFGRESVAGNFTVCSVSAAGTINRTAIRNTTRDGVFLWVAFIAGENWVFEDLFTKVVAIQSISHR